MDQAARPIPREDIPPERVCLVRQAESFRVETTPVSLARPMRAAPTAVREVMGIIRDMSRPHVTSGVGVPEDTAAVATEVATVAARAVVAIAVAEAVPTAVVRAAVHQVVATAEAVPPVVGILADTTGSHGIPPLCSAKTSSGTGLHEFFVQNTIVFSLPDQRSGLSLPSVRS